MPAYKDEKQGTWYTAFYCTDWQGKRKKKMKRGFPSKREALAWERCFLQQEAGDLAMPFSSFVSCYTKDKKAHLKQNTWLTKESILQKKILPYFKDKKMCNIKPTDVMAWQAEMMQQTDQEGKTLSPGYLKTMHNQLSALFNHAVKYYGLNSNPAAKAGNMGSGERKEIPFWTQAEYLAFSDAMMDKPLSYYAFEMLYWCGCRLGELLALTAEDFDFQKGTVRISKSYQRIHGEDVITKPKTPKSNRTIQMPPTLCAKMQDYLSQIYQCQPKERIFPITKSYLHHEMRRGCQHTGVQKITIHALRHSHISLLIDMGFSAVAIADRVGHESIDMTYRYAHLFPSKQTEMAERLEALQHVGEK